MSYQYNEKKIVIVLSSKIQPEIALNVVGHLSISLGAYADKTLMGRKELLDNDNLKHIGISKYPLICTKVKPSKLKKVVKDCRSNAKLLYIDFPINMLETNHDDELFNSLKNTKEDDINYLGILIYGDSIEVNTITSKFTLWKS